MLLDCRGVMEGDQSCYTVNKSEKSADYKQVQISTLTHTRTHTWFTTLHPNNISQSFCCTGTWSVFTYLLLSVLAFALNNFLPSSQRYIVLLFPIV